MATPLMFRKRQLAAKVESTYGTAESLLAADAGFRVTEHAIKIVGETMEREHETNLGFVAGVPQDISTEVTFKKQMCGRGASSLPAWAELVFPSCAMPVTVATYATSATIANWKSLTCGLYQDGRNKVARGVMGSFKIGLVAGKSATLDFSGKGGWSGSDPSDVAMLSNVTYTEAVPPIFAGTGAFAVGSGGDAATYKISKADIDLGAEVSLREDANSAGGYIGGWIGAIKPKITLDPEAQLFATRNWYANHRAGTELTLTFIIGSATNNTITITATNCQLNTQPTDEDRNGKLVDALGFNVNGTLSIAFS